RRACVYAFEAGKSGGPRAHLVHSRLPTNARPPPRRRPRPFARAGSGGPEKGADRPISPAGAVGTSVRVFPGRKRGLSVRKAWFCCALVGVAVLSSALTAVLLPRRQVVVVAATAKAAEADRVRHVTKLPRRVSGTAPARHRPVHRKARRHATPAATHITHGPTVTPSLYERTTSPKILRAQGCRAGRVRTKGLVVLDFGKLAYRPRRGGYGTVTFANRFASNRSLGWAVKSYARGYSQCLPKFSHAHITLALGTSNFDQDVPSTY